MEVHRSGWRDLTLLPYPCVLSNTPSWFSGITIYVWLVSEIASTHRRFRLRHRASLLAPIFSGRCAYF